ncbi:hypothetical protein BJ322DRAFT_1210219 [Thelephora terrestris]|uniref:WW domain-containing protein n=1 Tax=Thelephora terrestris TaxID=56493 RepID=A0A9P6L8M2_9AGAM|nr:hypothetical protein BJ322DRAFT_1210219 [Thelephora terrestris]
MGYRAPGRPGAPPHTPSYKSDCDRCSYPTTTLVHSTMQTDRYPLPFGWIKEFDQASGRSFYVDTKATPPRSIWTHPYEDDEYLKAHPDVREKLSTGRFGGSDSNLLPPSFEESQRRHSFGGGRASSSSQSQATNMPVPSSSKQRGPIGSLKDHLFGTKEERKAEKLRKKEQDRAFKEAQRERIQQMNAARQQYYANQPQYGYDRFNGYDSRYCDPRLGGGSYYGGGGFGSNTRRGGGGGLALPLLGGLAGGLLLGDLLDDGFGGGGGGFGGGGFDGGFDGGFF